MKDKLIIRPETNAFVVTEDGVFSEIWGKNLEDIRAHADLITEKVIKGVKDRNLFRSTVVWEFFDNWKNLRVEKLHRD